MKWYRNKQMLNETFEQNINYLHKTKSEKTQCLLADYNNLIKDHLELLDENERLKKAIEILKDHVQFKLVPIVSNDTILEGAYHFGIKIDKYGYYATLPKIEAEVLKEVLENE